MSENLWKAVSPNRGKKSMIQALLKVQLGPDVPEKGVRTSKGSIFSALGFNVPPPPRRVC